MENMLVISFDGLLSMEDVRPPGVAVPDSRMVRAGVMASER
jgi:hypothetical protein